MNAVMHLLLTTVFDLRTENFKLFFSWRENPRRKYQHLIFLKTGLLCHVTDLRMQSIPGVNDARGHLHADQFLDMHSADCWGNNEGIYISGM